MKKKFIPEQNYEANIYYKKTRVRLLWMIVLSLFFVIPFPSRVIFSAKEFLFSSVPFFIFLGTLISLKSYPTISLIVLSTCMLCISCFFVSLLVFIIIPYGFDDDMAAGIFQIKRFLVFISSLIYVYLSISAFYYSAKWGAEKEILDRSFKSFDKH